MSSSSSDQDASGTTERPIRHYKAGENRTTQTQTDLVTVEEPLEIIVATGASEENDEFSLAITMRTPGDDEALVYGFLFTEGIIRTLDDIEKIETLGPLNTAYQVQNRIRVKLKSSRQLDLKQFQRHFMTNSACGVCGKSAIQALELLREPAQPITQAPHTTRDTLLSLGEKLRQQQTRFSLTGGIHGVALFNTEGTLIDICEDVGRHNAMDKLIGLQLAEKNLPLEKYMVMVSGRASFELVQKALMAGIYLFVAVGAPSSLAIDLARQHDMTLIGFLKAQSFNCYSGEWRIRNS